MQNITTKDELKSAIRILELEQIIALEAVREQGRVVYTSLKPSSLLRSTLTDVATSPYLIENLIGTALGLATGYISKKIVVGASSGLVRKIIGSVLQVGVTKIVTQNSAKIKSFGEFIIHNYLRKKEINSNGHG